MTEIVILNTEDEIKSFPLTQSIKLNGVSPFESQQLPSTIYLFRIADGYEHIALGYPRSYNLGLVKEEFNQVELRFELSADLLEVTATPKIPLNTASKYLLFISENTSEPFITVEKVVSKSNSSITVVTNDVRPRVSETTLTVNNTSSSSIRINVEGETLVSNFLINLKEERLFKYDNLDITFNPTLYVDGEQFKITCNTSTKIDSNLSLVITTANDEDIVPVEIEQVSKKLSNQDVLNFYATSQALTKEVQYHLTYLDENIFSVSLPSEITKADIDIARTAGDVKVAFNNYLLRRMGLYDDSIKLIVSVVWDEYSNSIVILAEENIDTLATEELIIDITGW